MMRLQKYRFYVDEKFSSEVENAFVDVLKTAYED